MAVSLALINIVIESIFEFLAKEDNSWFTEGKTLGIEEGQQAAREENKRFFVTNLLPKLTLILRKSHTRWGHG